MLLLINFFIVFFPRYPVPLRAGAGGKRKKEVSIK